MDETEEKTKKQINPETKTERKPLKILNQNKLDKNALHSLSWKQKLRESCYRRVKEDRNRLLWKLRLPLDQSNAQKECFESVFQDIVSDELKKIKDQTSHDLEAPNSISAEDDMLWDYDGLDEAYQGEREEILLEMQRIFYEDIRTELSENDAGPLLVDEEDEYLASAVQEYMQLNDGELWKEQTWCPVCKKGVLQEGRSLICCSLCEMKLTRGDEVNLATLRDRFAEAHEEHLNRGCKLKPEFCVENTFDITTLYMRCGHCDTFEVVI